MHSWWPLLAGVIVFIAFAIVARGLKLLTPAAARGGAGQLYTARKSILSPAERSFAGVMEGVLPDGVTWLAKVRVGDIVVTRKGLTPAQRAGAWNRVNQKHVDFLLVRISDFAPVLAIELDDRSHEEESRRVRDAFVDDVFRACALPLLHVTAKATYNPAELQRDIAAAVASPPAASNATPLRPR